jgi:tryptophanyl-tRNA synthetase
MLMAADILLYQTDGVPVGEDQRQHIELTRDIAQTFNHHYGDVFKVPEAWIRKEGARIMSLQDPTKKMSKSDPGGCVFLLDPPESIRKTIMRAVTDSGREVRFDESRPGLLNLLTIHQLFSDLSREEIEERFAGQGYGALKKEVADLVVEGLTPLQTAFARLSKDAAYVEGILKESADRIRPLAQQTMADASLAMGLG